jgi:hypothetical protein
MSETQREKDSSNGSTSDPRYVLKAGRRKEAYGTIRACMKIVDSCSWKEKENCEP